MKFYEKVLEDLKSRGLSDKDAEAILKRTTEIATHLDRWADNVEDYPEMLYVFFWDATEAVALDYIKENFPEAWFRPIFDKEHPLRKEFEEQQKNQQKRLADELDKMSKQTTMIEDGVPVHRKRA